MLAAAIVAAFVAAGCGDDDRPCHPSKLTLNYETRPYEWAWCLYADALITSPDEQNGHLV